MRECALAQGPAMGPAGCSIMWGGKPRTMPEGASQPVIARHTVVFVARDLRCCPVGRKLEATLRRPLFHPHQDVTNIPAAATITAKVTQPRPRSSGGVGRPPITLGSLVNKTTSRIRSEERRVGEE